ncbi:hypothetical protein FACS189490_09540 [Clostridia bacterium]|nr:hypothetical protein FACS189490_09540 [Clostridia bacterium]
MRIEAFELYRGIFWVIGQNDDRLLLSKVLCDASGEPLEHADFDSKHGDSFNHRKSWQRAAKNTSREIRRGPWNYFPRGRVEIKNGAAIVYHNPILSEIAEFEEAVINEFKLLGSETSIRFEPDFSQHYASNVEVCGFLLPVGFIQK